MTLWKVYLGFGCVALSLLLLLGVATVDRFSRGSAAAERAEAVLKERLSQVRQLEQEGRQLGLENPRDWAMSLLNQAHPGLEVSSVDSGVEPSSRFEAGVYDYVSKDLYRIRLQETASFREGFLGARSWFTEFTLLFGVWFFFALFFYSLLLRTQLGNKEFWIKRRVFRWMRGSGQVLTGLGMHLRELVRNAKDLVVAATRCRKELSQLKKSVDQGVHLLDVKQATLKEYEENVLASRALVSALRRCLSRFGEEALPILGDLDRLENHLSGLEKAGRGAAEGVKEFQEVIQPWSHHISEIEKAYREFYNTRDELSLEISATAEALSGHVRSVNHLKEEFERSYRRAKKWSQDQKSRETRRAG